MDLAFVPPLYPPKGNRAIYEVKPFSSALHRNLHSQRTSPCLATAATQTSQASEFMVENKKHDLLRAIQETKRGLVATADQRSSIEEALVSVEGYNMGLPIDLVKLDGTWRLQYTSAPDVLILFEAAARLPFFQVGHIFQKFECRDQSNGGVICNVVRWSIPTLLEEQEGATLPVSAKFDIVSARNIYLLFEEVCDVYPFFQSSNPYDQWEDYITFLIWMIICFWVVPLVVVEYSCLLELNLLNDKG
ncbi:probable plastid-lipid-associated protein 10, chloroplastic isoform X2 [Quercus suber]|uniref:probable plastid-lipid-associated protein 10, chloroplastic isoform X2 n=1 Tax=Quercus suber TaxID=58331 RepID=UPI0032E00127